jgi:Zn-dependent peptidase ImmA (M78 family)
MRRGFKAEAKRLALELRRELGINAHSPFDPYAFAEEYGIQVIRLSELRGPARDHFLKTDGSALSGALIPVSTGAVILENDAQPPARRRTTISHELAHLVLEHEFSASLSTDERKCGLGGNQENEADWLSGEMLIPTDGAIRLARADASDLVAASAFDVSLAVARWRMNQSGARIMVQRERAKRQSLRSKHRASRGR